MWRQKKIAKDLLKKRSCESQKFESWHVVRIFSSKKKSYFNVFSSEKSSKIEKRKKERERILYSCLLKIKFSSPSRVCITFCAWKWRTQFWLIILQLPSPHSFSWISSSLTHFPYFIQSGKSSRKNKFNSKRVDWCWIKWIQEVLNCQKMIISHETYPYSQ